MQDLKGRVATAIDMLTGDPMSEGHAIPRAEDQTDWEALLEWHLTRAKDARNMLEGRPHARALQAVQDVIGFIGDDPHRSGLQETPARVVKSWAELFNGYEVDIPGIFKVFDDQADFDGFVTMSTEFVSFCEHHMLPFYGIGHVAYQAQADKVIGASKLARLLDAYARRLQCQERICQQVIQALEKYLKPQGALCVIQAKHMCMSCRGVQKQHSSMGTSAAFGTFRDNASIKMEVLAMLGLRS